MEVVLALLILSTVAVSALRIGFSARQATFLQMDYVVAANLAGSKAEALFEAVRQDWWDGAANANQPLSVGTALGNDELIPVTNGKNYTRNYTVANVNMIGGGGQDYRKVDIRVRW